MNAERLFEHYERIADSPDAIPRLRRFVLDLAVRGKLVPQHPNDEPASELLKQIAAEKALLMKVGEFREPSSFVWIDRKDLPFVPASHWGWARLIDIARPSYGFAFPSGQFNSLKRGMPLIRIRDISSADTEAYFDGDYDPAYLVTGGDYLVGMDGDFNLRRWKGKDGLLNQRVMRVSQRRRRSMTNPPNLLIFLPVAVNAISAWKCYIINTMTDRPTGTEEHIRDFARRYRVAYSETPTDRLAHHITRLAGDMVELDEIERLLIGLQRAGHSRGRR